VVLVVRVDTAAEDISGRSVKCDVEGSWIKRSHVGSENVLDGMMRW